MADLSERHSRVVMVTGAARGIGRAIASRFVNNGDKVCATDILEDTLRETAAVIGAQSYPLDVTDGSAVKRCVRQIEADCGDIDVLVNNAGVMSRYSVEEMSEAEWDRVMDINAKGVFNCCHEVIPGMRLRGRGWIINIGSIWAAHAWPSRSVYAASKAAVEQFTRCFALEVAPDGILVNGISPGIMATEMTRRIVEDDVFRAAFMTKVALGSVGQPEEHIAGVALFLTSPAAGYMSGEVLEVHGGYY
ncbi:MAG: SDR family NAD(P)-dependent oxidoreductase [Candidatus Dormibacteraceae bacterium]